MSSSNRSGIFVWYDLMTTDVEGAIAFYEQIAGWGTQPFEGGGPPYTLFTLDDVPVGGVMKIDVDTMGDMPPNWMAHISSDDVDATSRRLQELGGQLHTGPTDIPEVGRYAVASDPQGAVFGIFTGLHDMGALPDAKRVGDIAWHELATSDYRAAFDFYRAMFGWNEIDDFDMGDDWIYLMFGHGDKMYGGIYDKTDEQPGPPAWLYYIHVEDADASVETVREAGGKLLNGPMDVPGGDRVAQCMDPQGAVFAVHASAS